eukprot:m.633160 g.633160  ORF g.633160 m.633160 type:complete len:68 (+) comp58297_c0_seq4:280-483(+)
MLELCASQLDESVLFTAAGSACAELPVSVLASMSSIEIDDAPPRATRLECAHKVTSACFKVTRLLLR